MNSMTAAAIAALVGTTAMVQAAPVEVAPLLATPSSYIIERPYQLYGWLEYSIEDEKMGGAIGVDYFLTERLTAFGEVSIIKLDDEELDFDTLDLGLSYSLTYNVSTYTYVEFDNDLNYDNLTVGMSFVY